MKDIKSYNELDDDEKAKRKRMENKIVNIMIIIFSLFVGLMIAFIVVSAKKIYDNQQDSSYEVTQDHYRLMQESRYKYCPYCGELLMDTDKGD